MQVGDVLEDADAREVVVPRPRAQDRTLPVNSHNIRLPIPFSDHIVAPRFTAAPIDAGWGAVLSVGGHRINGGAQFLYAQRSGGASQKRIVEFPMKNEQRAGERLQYP